MNRACVSSPKRRTTLTLPSEALLKAQKIAHLRSANLSAVVSEALEDLLRAHAAAERGDEVFNGYKRAFAGFSERELMVLDGFIPETSGQ